VLCVCNSWPLRNLLVIVLRLNKLRESIVRLHMMLLRTSNNFRPVLPCIFDFSNVVENRTEDHLPLH